MVPKKRVHLFKKIEAILKLNILYALNLILCKQLNGTLLLAVRLYTAKDKVVPFNCSIAFDVLFLHCKILHFA